MGDSLPSYNCSFLVSLCLDAPLGRSRRMRTTFFFVYFLLIEPSEGNTIADLSRQLIVSNIVTWKVCASYSKLKNYDCIIFCAISPH